MTDASATRKRVSTGVRQVRQFVLFPLAVGAYYVWPMLTRMIQGEPVFTREPRWLEWFGALLILGVSGLLLRQRWAPLLMLLICLLIGYTWVMVCVGEIADWSHNPVWDPARATSTGYALLMVGFCFGMVRFLRSPGVRQYVRPYLHNQGALPLDVLKIERAKSGERILILTESVEWDDFHAYASAVVEEWGGEIVGTTDESSRRAVAVVIEKQQFWLTLDDFPRVVTLHAMSEAATEAVPGLRAILRQRKGRARPLETLAFPVLAFGKDGTLRVHASPEDLARCTARAWSRSCFRDLHVVDAVAESYWVQSAALRDPGARWTLASLTNQRVSVDLELMGAGEASFDEVKQRTIEAIRRKPRFWESAMPLDEWVDKIRSTTDVRALCELLGDAQA